MTPARSWTLRVAHPADAGPVSALLDRSYPLLWQGIYESALIAALRPLVTRANPLLLASGTFFIAESKGGMAVGCGGWSPEAPGTRAIVPGTAHIRHFATDPDWLRLGIGAAMLARCIAEARTGGFQWLMADSAHGAERFYAASGFEVQGPSAAQIGDHVLPGTMMRCAL